MYWSRPRALIMIDYYLMLLSMATIYGQLNNLALSDIRSQGTLKTPGIPLLFYCLQDKLTCHIYSIKCTSRSSSHPTGSTIFFKFRGFSILYYMVFTGPAWAGFCYNK